MLWEIFEHGKTPYTDMEDNDVVQKVIVDQTYILEPISLESKEYTSGVYDIMVECWNSEPQNRPSFTELRKHFTRT